MVTGMIIVFGTTCYEAYGETIEDVVTLNLPHNGLTSTLQTLYCFAIIGSVPIMLTVPFNNIEDMPCFKRLPHLCSEKWNRYLMRITIMVLIAIVACLVPNFGLFLNLVGCFVSTALTFIFPVLFYEKTHENEITAARKKCHVALVLSGVFCGAISIFMSVGEIIAESGLSG